MNSRHAAAFVSSLIAAALAAPLAAQSGAPLFPMSVSAVGSVNVVVAHDLDGDGRQDLVVGDGESTTLHILMSGGNGAFTIVGPVGLVGKTINDIAVGAFNADAKPDLVVCHAGGLSILRGFGNGTFALIGAPLTMTGLRGVVVADFDGNGTADLAALDDVTDTVHLLSGSGTGSFTSGPVVQVAVDADDLAVGDFDDDGHADLATIHGNNGPASVDILLGDGDGGMRGGGSFPVGKHPRALSVGDFNGDGRQDIVTCNLSSTARLSVLLGLGNGSFASAVTLAAPSDILEDVAAADLDADGYDDIATGVSSELGQIVTYRGHADGSFTDMQVVPAGSYVKSLAPADFDGDGALDVAVGSFGHLDVLLLRGHGDGSFALNPATAPGGTLKVVADFNEDSFPDFATLAPTSVTISLGLGDATFFNLPPVAVANAASGLVAAQLDGDAHVDLAITITSGLGQAVVLLGQGDGSFTNAGSFAAGSGPGLIGAGDLSGDGVLDLVVVNAALDRLTTLRGLGGGQFTTVGSVAVGDLPRGLAIADFNEDGRADVATANTNGDSVTLLLGFPDASLGNAGDFIVHSEPMAIVAGDFDADGHADLATANAGPNTVTVFRGLGSASFTLTGTLPVGGDPEGLLVADMNGDGAQDLVSANKGQGAVTVLLGGGDGSFAVHGSFEMGWVLFGALAGDFDRDGRLDVVGSNGALLINQGGSPSFAWTNLGHQLAGAAGAPLLVGSGTLQPGTEGVLAMTHAPPGAPGALFVATASAPAPFKGGLLLPVPPIFVLGLGTDAQGAQALPWSAWPAGLSGLSLYFQCAVADGAAVKGVALSNALRADVP